MSKIIYRKVHTAPGVKQYLDEEKTQVNPAFEANSAYYAKAVAIETLSLRDMAKHITSHGSPYTVDVVMGVLEVFRSCLIEQLLESKKVKVEGLGTFYVTIANKAGGEKDLKKFSISTLAEGLRLRFYPETATEESISSKEFLKKAKFVDIASLAGGNADPEDEETDTTNDNSTVVDDNEGGTENGGGTTNESNGDGSGTGTITPGGDNGGDPDAGDFGG